MREKKEKIGNLPGCLTTEQIHAATMVTLQPVDEWRPSTLTEHRLWDLVGEGLLHPITLLNQLEWIAPSGED